MRPTVLLTAFILLAAPLAPSLAGVSTSPLSPSSLFADGSTDDAASEGLVLTQAPESLTADDLTPSVIAHVDTGINPYHEAFRSDADRAYDHPSTYLPGYPEDAVALNLTLTVSTVYQGLQTDADEWQKVEDATNDTVFWVPGTRIVAMRHFNPGGTACTASDVPPASYVNDPGAECTDHKLLDDHGHGTMTASRMAGAPHSLAPNALIASLEGLSTEAVTWAADAGWIDVQTNSWGSFYPYPASEAVGANISDSIQYAATQHAVFFASGNGAGGFFGGTPSLTWKAPTGAPGAILVGAHDNGYVTPWSGAPAHVVADGYAGHRASHVVNSDFGAHPMACCTSAASPYAAGAAAALVQEARYLLGDDTAGVHDGILAKGDASGIGTGPLADGELNVTELRSLVLSTAEARPEEGKDDGLLHWKARPADGPGEHAERWGPGANPFCQGCTTDPVAWQNVTETAPAYASIGYGAVNERSLQSAILVLGGQMIEPDRSDADAFFAKDSAFREALHQDLNDSIPGLSAS